jgi:hypothetical protein
MKDFNLAKYLKEHNLGSHGILGNYIDLQALKEEVDNTVTIELDMSWEPQFDAYAKQSFDDFNIQVKETDKPGTYEVTGRKEDILGYLRSEFYEMDEESIQQYYPELLDGMNEEAGYGNNEPTQKVPYVSTDKKLDGFGDKFKQINAVEEADGPPFGMPDKSEENPWMDEVDGTDTYKVGNWTCYYDYPGVLVWSYGRVPFSKLAVYATPNWEDDGTTPIQIDIDEETQDQMTLKQSEFVDFNEYATAMKPYLSRIEDLESNWGSLAPSEDLAELEKPENIYADDEDRLGSLGASDDRMMDLGGDQIEQGIISLLDDGFEPEDILDACKMLIDAQVNAAMQGKKY